MSGKFWQSAWSLVQQCTPVSEGCRGCWLRSMDKRFGKPWDGNVTFRADRLDIPLRTRKPTVFAIWSDLYHEAVTHEQIKAAFVTMAHCKQHTFLIITKRPERASGILAGWNRDGLTLREGFGVDLPNVYHLVTVENQEMADQRIPRALKIPGKVGLLIEPMLSGIDFTNRGIVIETGMEPDYLGFQDFSCVILGGETGHHARPMHPAWARSVRDQCEAAGVPFFLKHIDKKHGRILDEQEHNDLPWRAK